MTLIAGICGENACAITADNMVTFNTIVKSAGGTSSGQVLFSNMNDCSFKLFSPLSNCIATFAGNVSSGKKILEILKSTKKIESINELSSILRSFRPTAENHVIFLIGFFDSISSKTCLLKWESMYPDKLLEGSHFTAGSGLSILKEINPQLVKDLIELDGPIQTKGACLSFYYNQKLFHSLSTELSKIGVGGCFFSVCLNRDKFIPQDDSAILKVEIIPEKNMRHIPIIKLAYRKGILFVNSAIIGEKKALIESINCSDKTNEILDKYKGNSMKYLDFDLEEIWDLGGVKNIEIHFEFNKIPSQYIQCEPGQFLSFGKTRTDVKVDKKLEDMIEDLISKAK